jgi:hypothetical protein
VLVHDRHELVEHVAPRAWLRVRSIRAAAG